LFKKKKRRRERLAEGYPGGGPGRNRKIGKMKQMGLTRKERLFKKHQDLKEEGGEEDQRWTDKDIVSVDTGLVERLKNQEPKEMLHKASRGKRN